MGCNEFSGDPDVWRYLHCVEMFLAFCLALYLWTLTCNPYPKAWSKAVYFTGAAGVFAVGQSLFWIMEDYRHSDCLGVPWAIAFWMEFAFYSTAFVLQVYLLGYWYSVTSLAQPMEWHRFQIARFVLSWLVTLSVVFDGVIRVMVTKLTSNISGNSLTPEQQLQHATLLEVQYCAYSIFAMGMAAAAWLDVSRITKLLASLPSLPSQPSPLANTMRLAKRQLQIIGSMDLFFTIVTWAQVGMGSVSIGSAEWGYLVAASIAARHFSILTFLALNVHTLKASLQQSQGAHVHGMHHTNVQDNFRLLVDNPSQLSQPTRRSTMQEW